MVRYLSLLSLFLIATLVACRPATGSEPVSFIVFGDPTELAAYEELVAAFHATQSGIEIELRHIPDQAEYRRRLATDFAAGAPPDVMLLNYRRFATFAGRGGLEPLGPFLAASKEIAAGEFYPPTVDAFTLDGQLWCIPQNISSLVVYYNRDLFDRAGLAYPRPEWNWAGFLEIAHALTLDADGDGEIDQYGAGIDPTLFRLAPFIWQNGGTLVDDPQQPRRLALDEPASLEAFQWFVDLQVKEGVVPDAVAEAAESSESRFLNGRLGLYFNSRRGVPTYRTIDAFQWDVAPLPRNRGEAGILHSDGYCLAAAAENKEAAWRFIEFANSTAGQTLVAASGRTVPSRPAVATSPAFLNPAEPPANSHVYLDTIPTLGRVPLLTTWAAIEEIASREIRRAFYGQATVAEAIESAQQLTQPYFEEAADGQE